jgi:uncharacterized protein YbjT (DUF2867 family)
VNADKLILVTGASGYIGGLLIPALLTRGYRIRCLAREPYRLRNRSWFSQVEIYQGDVVSNSILVDAFQDVSTAYYLIHSMASGKHYIERDLLAASNFTHLASEAGVEHIIYLGGLADPRANIGRHMRSRIETGERLRQGDVPVTEFRASIIIGSGSISFEMIRFIAEQFPIMVGPRWLHHRAQPIAIQDMLGYLIAALETPSSRGRVYEVGGPEVMSYAETMLVYARIRGLKRLLVTLPIIPLWLMVYFIAKLTPVPASIASPLIDGMRSDSVVRDDSARRTFTMIQPVGYHAAVSDALNQLSPKNIEPVWENDENFVKIVKHEGFFIESRRIALDASPEAVFRSFTGLGGKHGWLYMNWLWRLRGFIDRLVGGPGLRGRQVGQALMVGDVVDFYRVEALNNARMMRLRAELKAPGAGWMEWSVKPQIDGGVLLTQTAFFAPKGVNGFLYWYLLYPIHRLVFQGLIEQIARISRDS